MKYVADKNPTNRAHARRQIEVDLVLNLAHIGPRGLLIERIDGQPSWRKGAIGGGGGAGGRKRRQEHRRRSALFGEPERDPFHKCSGTLTRP